MNFPFTSTTENKPATISFGNQGNQSVFPQTPQNPQQNVFSSFGTQNVIGQPVQQQGMPQQVFPSFQPMGQPQQQPMAFPQQQINQNVNQNMNQNLNFFQNQNPQLNQKFFQNTIAPGYISKMNMYSSYGMQSQVSLQDPKYEFLFKYGQYQQTELGPMNPCGEKLVKDLQENQKKQFYSIQQSIENAEKKLDSFLEKQKLIENQIHEQHYFQLKNILTKILQTVHHFRQSEQELAQVQKDTENVEKIFRKENEIHQRLEQSIRSYLETPSISIQMIQSFLQEKVQLLSQRLRLLKSGFVQNKGLVPQQNSSESLLKLLQALVLYVSRLINQTNDLSQIARNRFNNNQIDAQYSVINNQQNLEQKIIEKIQDFKVEKVDTEKRLSQQKQRLEIY